MLCKSLLEVVEFMHCSFIVRKDITNIRAMVIIAIINNNWVDSLPFELCNRFIISFVLPNELIDL